MKIIKSNTTIILNRAELEALLSEHMKQYGDAENLTSQHILAHKPRQRKYRFMYDYVDDDNAWTSVLADLITFTVDYLDDRPIKITEQIIDGHIQNTVVYKIDRRRRD